MRCRGTGPDDIPRLTALWREAFGDTDEEIARFFDALFPVCAGFGAEEDGALASMLFALPVTLARGPETKKAAYFYAVATDRAFRGRGLARALMAHAEARLQRRGVSCALLVPGEPSLVRFYEPLGYRQRTFLDEKTAEGVRGRGSAELISSADYAGLRETLLADVPHVRCGLPLLEYERGTRAFYALRLDGKTGCAAASMEGGLAVCDELLPDASMLPALMTALPAKTCRVRSPGGGTPFGMVKWLDGGGEPPYLAFAFD